MVEGRAGFSFPVRCPNPTLCALNHDEKLLGILGGITIASSEERRDVLLALALLSAIDAGMCFFMTLFHVCSGW